MDKESCNQFNAVSAKDYLFKHLPLMRYAELQSKKSLYKHKIGAILVAPGGRIIATGYNQIRHKRINNKWSKWEGSLHAEVACITKVDKSNIKRSILYIYRDGLYTPMLAKPCENCFELIKWVGGIKKVIYSTDNFPFFVTMNI